MSVWPQVTRDPAAMRRLSGEIVANDFEWNVRYGYPTIVSVSDGDTTVSAPWKEARPYFLELVDRHRDGMWAGHNHIGADLGVLRSEGIHIAPEKVWDTIILHWLVNTHLCKSTRKDSAGDGETRRGRGWMNLWSFASLYTDLPCWKRHRGEWCSGPCPECDPIGYCGIDSFAVSVGLPGVLKAARLRGVDKLYPLHRDLMVILADMQERGVCVNVPYVERLRADFQAAKLMYWNAATGSGSLPFNPESPKQVREFFKSRGVTLENSQEDTIRDAVADYPHVAELQALLEWKELGDGPDRWFAPRRWNDKSKEWEGYVDEDGFIHPSLGIYTSSGRMNCTDPNLQNVAKRRIDRATGENVGKRIRRAIVPREGHYFLKLDYSNAENRVMLWYGGYRDIPPTTDLHQWVCDIIGFKPDDELAIKEGSPRNAAKSIQHAGNYLEGLVLVDPADLRKPKIQHEIRVGARIVFPNWKFNGQIATFTGSNFAERAFGDKSYENRKRALAFSQKYFGQFPGVREAQQRITVQAERGFVQPPHGYYTLSYGYGAERMKTAAAINGSQPVAHFTKLTLRNMRDHPRMHPVLQVHDEILVEVEKSYSPRDAMKWGLECMYIETPEMPGLRLPVDGDVCDENWADGKTIYKQGAFREL